MPLERRRVLRMVAVKEEKDEEDPDSTTSQLLPLFVDEERSRSSSCASELQADASEKPEVTLDSFRDEWLRELGSKSKRGKKSRSATKREKDSKSEAAISTAEDLKFEKASRLFLEGADLERRGDMCDAVHRYMAAVRLVPDIEFKLFRSKFAQSQNTEGNSRVRSRSNSRAVCTVAEDEDLEGTLRRRIAQRGTFIESTASGAASLCSLPTELLLTILRYVVGSELDVRCLEMVSMACAGFYLLARDEGIWHSICRRIFGEIRLSAVGGGLYADWRSLFVARPHVYLHGVYIGKCTYLRHGEASFQDQFYRPWHIVVYYRHMRFFADGTAIMVTSSEPPAQIVPQLKSKFTRLSGVLLGRYWLVGPDHLAIQFTRHCERTEHLSRRHRRLRQKENFVPHEVAKQEFNMEMRFGDGKRRSAHCALLWEKYDCAFTYLNGDVMRSALDVSDHQAFPPLFFSRVKSFAIPESFDEMLV